MFSCQGSRRSVAVPSGEATLPRRAPVSKVETWRQPGTTLTPVGRVKLTQPPIIPLPRCPKTAPKHSRKPFLPLPPYRGEGSRRLASWIAACRRLERHGSRHFHPFSPKANGTRKNVEKQAKMPICVQIVNKKCSTLFTKNRGKVVLCKKHKSRTYPFGLCFSVSLGY